MMLARGFLFFAVTLLSFCTSTEPQHFDVLVQHASVVDGTGNPWYKADVGVRGDRIVAIGNLDGATATRTIDATGKVLSPGFIDMLGQSELELLIDNRALSKISQGVTTEITGEGESVAPVNEETLKDLASWMRKYHVAIDWKDLDGYFRRLEEHRSAINLATFVGAAQVRTYVIGYNDRPPTSHELEIMKELVRQAMQQGALGLSTSLIYPPGSYAKTQELIELTKEVAPFGGIYISHIRDEGDVGKEKEAIYEAADIARAADVPVEIWHLKVAGKHNWGTMADIVRLIQLHRNEGIDMTADVYPYVASANGLIATMPEWAHNGGTGKLLERIRTPETRQKILEEIKKSNFGSGIDFEGIQITDVYNPDLERFVGKRLIDIAREWNKDPYDALFEFILADSGRTGRVTFSMFEPDLRIAMAQPWVSFDTDYGEVAPDGPLSTSKPHPRTYGTFPRILGKYVREAKVLTLEDAIRKMTSLAATRVGLKDRGCVRVGDFADLVVFDPNTVNDNATFEQPHQFSTGIEFTIVNGQVVWENGKWTGQLPGKPLRGPGWKQQ